MVTRMGLEPMEYCLERATCEPLHQRATDIINFNIFIVVCLGVFLIFFIIFRLDM